MVDMGNVWDRTTEFLSDNAARVVADRVGDDRAAGGGPTVVSGAVPTVSPDDGLVVSLPCARCPPCGGNSR